MQVPNNYLQSFKQHFQATIVSAETYFNRLVDQVDFTIFCLIYTLLVLWLLRRFTREAIFRPEPKQLIGTTSTSSDWKTRISKKIKAFIVGLPILSTIVNRKFTKKMSELSDTICNDMEKVRDRRKSSALPPTGMTEKNIRQRINQWFKKEQTLYTTGKISGSFYTDDQEHFKRVYDFAAKYMYQNPLHLDTYKELLRMEAEVLGMTSKLISPNRQAYGVLTSGGSESLLMAIYAYRKYYSHRTKPNIVVPNTIHAAVDKGCFYLNVQIRKARVDSNFQADIGHMKSLIDSNTILLMGSYPNYPHGIIDPIREIAKLAKKHDIGMHIDGCLGGFIAAFSSQHKDNFSMEVEGVTSISLDQHKFGLAPKGISSIFFKTKELRHCMYYIQTEWIGAVYATPSFAGSRSGFSSAGAWYSLLNVTKKGYNENSRTIIAATKETVKALRSIEGVTVFGEPCICALAFSYSTPYISCFDIVSYLVKVKGWELSPIHLPNGIHVSMTLANYEAISKQLPIDVKSAIQYLSANPPKQSATAALYGASSQLPTDELGEQMIKTILSATLR